MKINFVWFSCQRDIKALYYSLRSVNKLFPDSRLYVFLEDHFDCLIDIPNVEIITPEKKWGNLNGGDFVKFELDVFLGLANSCDYLIKMDSDVLLFNKNFVERFCEQGIDFFGKNNRFENTSLGFNYCYGGLYGMKSKFLLDIENPFSSLALIIDKFPSGNKIAEDECISLFFQKESNTLFFDSNSDKKEVSVLGFWRYDQTGGTIPLDHISQCILFFDGVEFGRLSLLLNQEEKYKLRDDIMKTIYTKLLNK